MDPGQPGAHLVGDEGVGMPDDRAEIVDGVHFTTHRSIMPADD
jgi:hypothetical protein